jgi:hypothetical protein
MEVLARIGGGAYALVAFVIGLRLLLLALRTRRLPELLVGAGVLCLAGLGYPLSAVVREAPELAGSVRGALGAAAGLLAAIGVTANTGFTWVLFRRGVRWAAALFGGVACLAAALFAAQSLRGGWDHGETFWGWLPIGITLSFGWGFLECGRYHLLLRRRLRLGLADPVVTDRFALYAGATGLGVLTNLVGWVFWWRELEMLTHPLGAALLFALGSTSSVLMLLAFLPPRAYLARLRARASGVA